MSNWNPLYPSNNSANPLEEAAREAEWEDSMRELEEKRRRQRGLGKRDEELEELKELEDLFS